ncbi:NAD(P)/FAD-dependent oxidoreductase [Actinophytocola oryzae]|nr:FAD-binding monooxygenase [Actinophytocola oryzae]
MGQDVPTRAVVLGGSIAGLFAAKVLADAYDEVHIVDRDKIVGLKGPRKHCPQTYQANGLLTRGVQIMEELFPGIKQQLLDDDIPTGDVSGEVRWYFQGNRLKQVHGDLFSFGIVRPLLEYYIRERVQLLPNVKFFEEYDILGITASADRSRITGARIQARGKKEETVLDADLVVDATGRGSRTPVWLEQLGYAKPEEERKKIDLAYVTQHFKLRPGVNAMQGDHAINPVGHAGLPRGAVFFRVDGGRLEVTTYGILGDHPPTDQAGLYEWLKSLPARDVYDVLRWADPVDEPVKFKFPTTLRRNYHKLTRFPDNLLVTGDAITCFNPVYAQGMTIAGVCAQTIRQHLHSGAAPDPLDYFRDLAKNGVDAAWDMTNVMDLAYPKVPGNRTFRVRMQNAFLKRVQIAATHDAKVTLAYMKAATMVAGPEVLMNPAMILRVLWKSARGPSKESRQPFTWEAPAGIEPVVQDTDLPKAA